MKISFLCMLLATFTLVGCATSSVSKNYQFQNGAKEGLVVLSITVDGTISDYSLSFGNSRGWEFVQFAYGTPASLFETKDIESGNTKGKLFAVKMPPGNYSVTRWGISSGSYSNSSTDPIDIEFKVEAGKATYIGNYHFLSRKASAMWKVNAQVFQKNEFNRDIGIFKKKFPLISESSVISIIKDGEQSKQIGGLTSHTPIETPVIIPNQ